MENDKATESGSFADMSAKPNSLVVLAVVNGRPKKKLMAQSRRKLRAAHIAKRQLKSILPKSTPLAFAEAY
jgi:hypothetical protein